jgi:hypothetical protein
MRLCVHEAVDNSDEKTNLKLSTLYTQTIPSS